MKNLIWILIIAGLTIIFLPKIQNKLVPQKQELISTERIKIQKECSQDQICFTKQIQNLVHAQGYKHASLVLSDLVSNQDPKLKDCHLMAHGIGRGIFEANKNDWRTIIGDVDFMCNYGIPHGIIESYLLSLKEGSISDTSILKGVCPKDVHLSCYHVIGHILVLDNAGNVDNALDKCDIFQTSQVENCYDGAFMENTYNSLSLEHGLIEKKYIKPFSVRIPELVQFCNKFGITTRNVICFREIARAGLIANKYNLESALRVCDQALKPEAKEECVKWMNADMAQRKNKKNKL
ncbi:MAG TPA: hypothetical protein VM077_05860 [Candidatus Limnocylindrales bacterium]|nr:hypothetical protein [Candidatus Limnocylindrales bacterium]